MTIDRSQATPAGLAFEYAKAAYAQYLLAKSQGRTVEDPSQKAAQEKAYRDLAAENFSKKVNSGTATYTDWQEYLAFQLNDQQGSNNYRSAYVSTFGAYPEMHGASPSKAAFDVLTAVQSGQMGNDPGVIKNYLQAAYHGISDADVQKIIDFANKTPRVGTNNSSNSSAFSSLNDQVNLMRGNNEQALFQSYSGSNSDLIYEAQTIISRAINEKRNFTPEEAIKVNAVRNEFNRIESKRLLDELARSNNGPGSKPTYYGPSASPQMIKNLLDFAREEYAASKTAGSAKMRKVHEIKAKLSVIAGLMTTKSEYTYGLDAQGGPTGQLDESGKRTLDLRNQLGVALSELHMDYRLQGAGPEELKAAAAQILNELDPESQNLLINGRPPNPNTPRGYGQYNFNDSENINPFSPLHQFSGLFKDLVGKVASDNAAGAIQQNLRFIKVTIYNNRFNTPVTKAFSEISQSLNDPQFTTSDKNLITEIAQYVSKPSMTLRGVGVANFGEKVETNPWTNLNFSPDLSPEELQAIALKLDNIAVSLKATDLNKSKSFETVSTAIKLWASDWSKSQARLKEQINPEITINGAIEREEKTNEKGKASLDELHKDLAKVDTVIDKSVEELLSLGRGGSIDDDEFLLGIIAARKSLEGDFNKRLNTVVGDSEDVRNGVQKVGTERYLKLQMLDTLLYAWGSKAQVNLTREQKREIQENYAPGETFIHPGIDYDLSVDEFKKSLLANLERLRWSLSNQSSFTGRTHGSIGEKDFAWQELVNTLIHEDAFTTAFGYYFIDEKVVWYVSALTPREEGMTQKERSIAEHDTYLKGLKEGINWKEAFESNKAGNNITSPDFSVFDPPSIETYTGNVGNRSNSGNISNANDLLASVENEAAVAEVNMNLASQFPSGAKDFARIARSAADNARTYLDSLKQLASSSDDSSIDDLVSQAEASVQRADHIASEVEQIAGIKPVENEKTEDETVYANDKIPEWQRRLIEQEIKRNPMA